MNRRHSTFGIRFAWIFAGLLLLLLLVSASVRAAGDNDAIVLCAEEIRAMKAHKIAEVLNHVPGVTAGDSSVGIHGVYKVKVFVDGRPINDPTSSHGAVNWDLVSLDEVERIEILRGKGGLKYGQDASGGVVLITTRRIHQLTGTVKTYAGSHGTLYGHGSLHLAAGDLGIGFSGGGETTDGYTVNNDKERRQGGLKLTYRPSEEKSLAFSADHLADDRGSSGPPDHPTPFARKSTRTTALSMQGRYDRTTATAFFNQGENHNTDTSKNLDQTLRVTETGQDIGTSLATGSLGELSLGAACRQGRAEGSTFEDQSERTFSLFGVQALQWPASPFSLTAGLRVNVNSAFDDALNPEIKAAYKQERWRLTAACSRTNNTPSFYQRYNRTSSTRPNPDLSMETADNYSLALFLEPRPAVSASVSLFHNRLSDRITYVTDEDGIGQYQNFGKVTYTGGDLALTLRPHETVTVKGGYTRLEAKDAETGLWIPAKAEHQASLDLFWRPVEAFSTVLTAKSVSAVYRDKSNTRTVPAYTIADFRAEYAFARFSLFAEIENLSDQRYFYSDGLPAPPCTWIAGITWRI